MARTKQPARIRNPTRSYIPKIKKRDINDYPMNVRKINEDMCIVTTIRENYIIDTNNLKVITSLKSTVDQLLVVVAQKFIVMLSNHGLEIFDIKTKKYQEIDYEERKGRQDDYLIEMHDQFKVGICWQNEEQSEFFVSIFELRTGKAIHRKTSRYIYQDKEKFDNFVKLQPKGYYVSSACEYQNIVISKLKFHENLKIKMVQQITKKFINASLQYDETAIKLRQKELKFNVDRDFTAFYDVKKQSTRQFQALQYRDMIKLQNMQVLPGYHSKKFPYFTSHFNGNYFYFLMNAANCELIYHLLDFSKSYLIQKAKKPIKKLKYEGKPEINPVQQPPFVQT